MKKWLMILCLLCIPAFACAADFYVQSDMVVKDLHAPVGITFDGGFMYVSSMGPTYHKEVDGYIVKHNLVTGEDVLLLQNQINSPKSMVAFDGKLIFIDPYADRDSGMPSVILADLAQGTIIDKVNFEAGFPFDIERINEHEFVVSDSKLNRLYLITLDGDQLKAEVWQENVPGAKGLAMLEDCLYIAGYAVEANKPETRTGMVYQVHLPTKELTPYLEVATPAETLNAIAFKDYYMFVGDWGSKKQETVSVYVYHVQNLDFVTEFKNVTPGSDFVFSDNALYLTDMTGGKVVKLEIDLDALDKAALSK